MVRMVIISRLLVIFEDERIAIIGSLQWNRRRLRGAGRVCGILL